MSVYFLRGTAVALSEFVLIYFATWFAISYAWSLWPRSSDRISRRSSNFLFALQLTPFLGALLAVVVLAVPAFVRFEPRGGEEDFGAPVIVLGALCLAVLSMGAWRSARAILEMRRLARQWKGQSVSADDLAGLPVMKTSADAPPLVVVGLIRPRLYVSSSASATLNEQELARAIAHESAHVQRHDNLKKLALRLCCLPFAGRLERQWLASLEIAADMAAVRSQREALDLASALVKASKLAGRSPDLSMTFTVEGSDLLKARVERLLGWKPTSGHQTSRTLIYSAISVTAITLLLSPWYSAMLLAVHEFSEVLVR